MELSEKDFPILDALDNREITTQRELADHAGVSLGQVNYVLKGLMEKGFVKIGNFCKSPRKIGYVYHLTPKGLEAKAALAGSFMMSKLKQYHEIRERLADKLAAFENGKECRVFFVGPSLVGNLLDSIIREKGLNMILAGQCRDLEGLKDYQQEFFDIALLFDGNGTKLKNAVRSWGLPEEKLFSLW
jgi:EPS-associated MarR family transcriptional regulator